MAKSTVAEALPSSAYFEFVLLDVFSVLVILALLDTDNTCLYLYIALE